ncbi:MAG: hypothetical protein ABSG84_04355 [Acidobacteriaceae bacterium]|jgi:hypothetical protein
MIPLLAGFYAMETLTKETDVLGQQTNANAANTAYTPQSPPVVAGEVDVKQLLLLMDTDKDGKISRKEFMDFMTAEFDRLDTDKNGELDVKELEKSQLTTTRHGGTRR